MKTLQTSRRIPKTKVRATMAQFHASLFILISLVLGLGQTNGLAATINEPPERMTYQSYLVDADGNPLATNAPINYTVEFRIFDSPQGGSALWAEGQIVTVDKGNFSVLLGEGSPISGEDTIHGPLSTVFTGTGIAERYIEMTVWIDSTPSVIAPRVRLLPTPFAFTATSSLNLVAPDGSRVVSYNGDHVQIAGEIRATDFTGTFSGDGSGLTGISPADDSITADKIVDAAVRSEHLAVDSVSKTNLADFAVDTMELADEAVTEAKLADGSVTAVKLGSNVGVWRSFANSVNTYYNSGNVGIGTSTPGSKLHINAQDALQISANEPFITLNDSSSPNYRLRIQNFNGDYLFKTGINDDVRMQIKQNGFVGIGVNPSYKLHVNGTVSATGDIRASGDFRMGSSGQYYATGGRENLRIVRGIVNANGTKAAGDGFTVQKPGEGDYRITFTDPFGGIPAITVTTDNPLILVGILGQTQSDARIGTHDTGTSYLDRKFNFIAIGPR